MVNPLLESNYKKPETESTNTELQDIDEREIVALETTKVKEEHSDFSREKEMKEVYPDRNSDRTILDAISISEKACRINLSIYALMTCFGAAFFAYALLYSAINGFSLYSTIFASLGIASLISVLVIAPQSKISKSAGKIIQFQILHSAYLNQVAVLRNRDAYDNVEKSTEDAGRTSKLLEQVTFNTIDKIENLVDSKSGETVNKRKTSA